MQISLLLTLTLSTFSFTTTNAFLFDSLLGGVLTQEFTHITNTMTLFTPKAKFITRIPKEQVSQLENLDWQDAALAIISSASKESISNLEILSSDEAALGQDTSSNFFKVELQHIVRNIPVYNHHASVTFSEGKVVSYTFDFTGDANIVDCLSKKSEFEALQAASKALDALNGLMLKDVTTYFEKTENTKIKSVWIAISPSEIVPACLMELSTNGEPRYKVAIDKCTLNLVYLENYLSN